MQHDLLRKLGQLVVKPSRKPSPIHLLRVVPIRRRGNVADVRVATRSCHTARTSEASGGTSGRSAETASPRSLSVGVPNSAWQLPVWSMLDCRHRVASGLQSTGSNETSRSQHAYRDLLVEDLPLSRQSPSHNHLRQCHPNAHTERRALAHRSHDSRERQRQALDRSSARAASAYEPQTAPEPPLPTPCS